MKACLGDDGCGGTGSIFGGVGPLRWAMCIACKGTGFVQDGPVGPAEIRMPTLGTITKSEGHVFNLSDFADVKNPLMAHVMVKAGIFPSVGQARKNGWNKPLTEGEWILTKKKIKVSVRA